MKRIYHPTARKTPEESEPNGNPVATLLSSIPGTLTALRASHQIFARLQEEGPRQAELSTMHQQICTLAGSVSDRKIAQMLHALEALVVHLHAKPNRITPSVIRTLAQAIDTLASLFNRATDPQPEVLVPSKILVVDDEVISREIICSALAKANLTPISLDNSLAAQHLLEKEHFDLIFLDVEMPGKNGLELCLEIRGMNTNCSTPVVFVTAHSDFGKRAQSALSGGNDFIAKPFLSVELAAKAFTCLFKENWPPPAIVVPPVESALLESQPSAAHAQPNVCGGIDS